jgi:hypothetical protein
LNIFQFSRQQSSYENRLQIQGYENNTTHPQSVTANDQYAQLATQSGLMVNAFTTLLVTDDARRP